MLLLQLSSKIRTVKQSKWIDAIVNGDAHREFCVLNDNVPIVMCRIVEMSEWTNDWIGTKSKRKKQWEMEMETENKIGICLCVHECGEWY